MIKRRNYFISRGFQLNFAFKFIILIILEAVLIAGLFIYVSGNTLTTGYTNSVLTIDNTNKFFLFPMAIIMLITAVGIGMVGMLVFILLSHRIAGPLYRFEKDLEEIGHGDLTKRINTRKNDQLIGVKEALNTLTGAFDERIGRIKTILAELNSISKTDDSRNAAGINNAVKKLSEELGKFKVTSGSKE